MRNIAAHACGTCHAKCALHVNMRRMILADEIGGDIYGLGRSSYRWYLSRSNVVNFYSSADESSDAQESQKVCFLRLVDYKTVE